ncbi:hypothetical protein SAMN05518849_12936 [Sphingobium sp. AP50]|uniref:hypothetical protein n=1 Tax=Sphingobium sp. AP50 TaxID=1884369 RepID=UPI0008BBA5D5|nr:hypothetical protein [Sphingobium sp. AP50]SEK02835.1 hypothetical protein SAMN05518849_12936 [Sphingobium sp. AP50]
MTDLDQMLDAMRAMPADTRLAGMDDAVLTGMVERRERMTARRSLMLASILAIGIGWIGSILPAAPAQAMPIGMSDYAPSRLLGQ